MKPLDVILILALLAAIIALAYAPATKTHWLVALAICMLAFAVILIILRGMGSSPALNAIFRSISEVISAIAKVIERANLRNMIDFWKHPKNIDDDN